MNDATKLLRELVEAFGPPNDPAGDRDRFITAMKAARAYVAALPAEGIPKPPTTLQPWEQPPPTIYQTLQQAWERHYIDGDGVEQLRRDLANSGWRETAIETIAVSLNFALAYIITARIPDVVPPPRYQDVFEFSNVPLPCPICGAPPNVFDQRADDGEGYSACECPNNGNTHFAGVHADTQEAAIRGWNMRPPTASPRMVQTS